MLDKYKGTLTLMADCQNPQTVTNQTVPLLVGASAPVLVIDMPVVVAVHEVPFIHQGRGHQKLCQKTVPMKQIETGRRSGHGGW